MSNPIEKFQKIVKTNNSLLCIGLDSDIKKLPAGFDQLQFNKAIIDSTNDLVCAYKPNSAFYEALGAEGIVNLKKTCDYIKSNYKNIPIILDAKRADIGNTNNGYIDFAFDYLGVDAITVQPYMGAEALQPFLDRTDKTIIVLCRTSNIGSKEFQDVYVDGGRSLYELVAHSVSKNWNKHHNCMLVVGATYPKEAAAIRTIVGDNMWFLVPGIGAQGGDVEATVKASKNSQGSGIIINSSRGIIFAGSGQDFAKVARSEAKKLRDQINKYR